MVHLNTNDNNNKKNPQEKNFKPEKNIKNFFLKKLHNYEHIAM